MGMIGEEELGAKRRSEKASSVPARIPRCPTLLGTNMETQKGPHKDYSPFKRGLYGFPC